MERGKTKSLKKSSPSPYASGDDHHTNANVFSDIEESLTVRRQTVLIVDDEEDILESLESLLTMGLKGLQIRTADSAAVGLQVLRREALDLILSDYKMPKMSGLDFLREVRKMAPSIPRVLITAYPDLDLAIKAINEAKIENFITKPFEPEKVLEVVRDLLYERRAQQLRDASFSRSLEELRRKAKTSS